MDVFGMLLLIRPVISSFSFPFFQTLQIFVTLLSGTVRRTKLKLGTHVDSGWMYHVTRNQTAAVYSSCYFFIFRSNFSNIKNFRHTSLRYCEAYKADTWYTRGQWVDVLCIPQSYFCFLFVLYVSFFFLSNVQTLKLSSLFLSGTLRPIQLKLGTHVDNGWMYRLYRDHAAEFICTFPRNCEAYKVERLVQT